MLQQLFNLPLKMAFKGGTSLSKVFGLIHRFSEDVDVTIDYRNFVNNINFETASRTQIKKTSELLKANLKTTVETSILPYLKHQTCSMFCNRNIDITLSEDGEKLSYFYPGVLDSKYLREHVLIEFGVRNSTEPCDQHMIRPFLANVLDETIILPHKEVYTLSPIRTFWEKATLHVECYRKRLFQSPERLSRHWYDLFMLNKSWVVEKAFSQINILEDVIQHKGAFFNAKYSNYEKCLDGNFTLIPDSKEKSSLEKDYRNMREAGMFLKEPPPFSEIMKSME